MTPAQLRAWLAACVGRTIVVQPGHQNAQPPGPASQTPNISIERYIPITVDLVAANAGPPTLQIANSTLPMRHGVYLPDALDQCSRVNATPHGIVISGRFTGCRFVKCLDAANQQHVGHVYVNSGNPSTLPVAQAQAFKAAVGAIGHHSDGFLTHDLVQPPATHGYVFGTLDQSQWRWHWVTVSGLTSTVVGCVDITAPGNWVSL